MKKFLTVALSALLVGTAFGLSAERKASVKTSGRATPGGDRYVVVLSLDGLVKPVA